MKETATRSCTFDREHMFAFYVNEAGTTVKSTDIVRAMAGKNVAARFGDEVVEVVNLTQEEFESLQEALRILNGEGDTDADDALPQLLTPDCEREAKDFDQCSAARSGEMTEQSQACDALKGPGRQGQGDVPAHGDQGRGAQGAHGRRDGEGPGRR